MTLTIDIQFDATAGRWHVIQGYSWVRVLFRADTEAECKAWLASYSNESSSFAGCRCGSKTARSSRPLRRS